MPSLKENLNVGHKVSQELKKERVFIRTPHTQYQIELSVTTQKQNGSDEEAQPQLMAQEQYGSRPTILEIHKWRNRRRH